MPKRRPSQNTAIDDIFEDTRLTEAMTKATAPVEENPPETVEENPPEAKEHDEPTVTAGKLLQHPTAQHQEKPSQSPSEADSKPVPVKATQGSPEPEKRKNEALKAPEANVPLKARVPRTLRSNFAKLIADLSAALDGVKLDDSNILRPVIERLILKHEYLVEAFTAHAGELKRPPNGDAVAMLEFDDAIGKFIDEAEKLQKQRNRRVSHST
jgi:hypothetical protein